MVRIKHRYILAQVLLDPAAAPASIGDITAHDIISTLREKISSLYGDVGAGDFGSSVAVKYFDQAAAPAAERCTYIFVLRCAREAEQQVRFALCTVSSIKRTALILRTLGVAGSSRTCADKVRSIACLAIDSWGGASEKDKKEKKRKLLEGLKEGIE